MEIVNKSINNNNTQLKCVFLKSLNQVLHFELYSCTKSAGAFWSYSQKEKIPIRTCVNLTPLGPPITRPPRIGSGKKSRQAHVQSSGITPCEGHCPRPSRYGGVGEKPKSLEKSRKNANFAVFGK